MWLRAELGLEVGLLAAAHTGPGRITALRHEAGDHAVEHHAVVKAVAREARDSLDMAGREVGAQLDDDIAAGRKGQGQGVGVGHKRVSEKGVRAAL